MLKYFGQTGQNMTFRAQTTGHNALKRIPTLVCKKISEIIFQKLVKLSNYIYVVIITTLIPGK
jgi:hypothetical protein